MIVGYVGYSNSDYFLQLQIETLKKYGCDQIFHSKKSTSEAEYIQVLRVLDLLKSEDQFVVCKLKHLADSITQLFEITNYIREKDIIFVSIQDQVDTHMPTGKIMFKTLEILDEFSRNIIHERKIASLKTGRPRGRNGGRPKVNQQKLNEAISLYLSQKMTVLEIQEATGISRTTLYRSLKKIKK
ncbi:recombinase family protein [Priestia megaterium]|uniref:recombinase family protein n=1 Tax=Priestia megaterium TaxID=1404 RepID=UPI002E1CA967|nr:recombinase family protein [Priestia megaterium]MED4298893.1 recombinase family protein [Priestia megaterium]